MNNGTVYTPGPWRAINDDVANATISKTMVVGGDDRVVASVYCPFGRKFFPEEVIATARLIAAAPDMLRALEDAEKILLMARRYFPKPIKNRDTFDLENILANSVRPAMRKAKGANA